jgi:Prenylcysteine lyase
LGEVVVVTAATTTAAAAAAAFAGNGTTNATNTTASSSSDQNKNPPLTTEPPPPGRLLSYRSATDGHVYELGTAVLSQRHFPLVTAMAKSGNDPLPFERPRELGGISGTLLDAPESVMMFHNGGGRVAFQVKFDNVTGSSSSSSSSSAVQNAFWWRYNLDLYVLYRLATKVLAKLQIAHQILMTPPSSRDGRASSAAEDLSSSDYHHRSPMALWEEVGLSGLVGKSLDEVCDRYLVATELPFWRRYLLPGQGSFRNEVLNSIVLSAHHQDASQINALAGLAALLAAADWEDAYSIAGGNSLLIAHAWEQARGTHASRCPDGTGGEHQEGSSDSKAVLTHVPKRVSTVVGSIDGFDLYDDQGAPVGTYDILILAVPIPTAKIEFLIRSHIDETVLQPMPLGGLVENSEDIMIARDDHNHHHGGHSPLPLQLPKTVTRPYVPAVTTIVRKATLQREYWLGKKESRNSSATDDPEGATQQLWQIYMTPRGKADEHNITAVHQLSPVQSEGGGMYKIISSQSLPLDTLRTLFGRTVEVEYEQRWEASAPDFRGRGSSTDFLIYDGATGFHGHTRAGAMYYPSAMELTLSNPEAQAMGAKAVANLIARRLGWLETERPRFDAGDEL